MKSITFIILAVMLALMLVVPASAATAYTNVSSVRSGYTMPFQFLSQTWVNDTKNYFGPNPLITGTVGGMHSNYVLRNGTIKGATLFVQSGVCGTDIYWPLLISINRSTNNVTPLVSNVTTYIVGGGCQRYWYNDSMNIPVKRGDSVEMMLNVLGMPVKASSSTGGGYVYIQEDYPS